MAMAVLIIMLIVAIIPTGGYGWYSSSDVPQPHDYAICYLKPINTSATGQLSMASMVISVLLLAAGFVTRSVRLFEIISVQLVAKARASISSHLRGWLRHVYGWCCSTKSRGGLRRLFCYRPLLATFLMLRLLADVWTSMFIEVRHRTIVHAIIYLLVKQIWWLIASFSWGILRLVLTLRQQSTGPADWSFGQIAPVVLLVAPVLAISEYMFADERTEAIKPVRDPNPHLSLPLPGISTRPGPPSPSSSAESVNLTLQPRVDTLVIVHQLDQAQDDPDHDFYQHCSWSRHAIFFIACDVVLTTVFTLTTVSWYGNSDVLIRMLLPTAMIQEWLPVYHSLLIFAYISNCLLIDSFREDHPSLARGLFWGLFLVSMASVVATNLPGLQLAGGPIGSVGSTPMIGVYLFGCLIYKSFPTGFNDRLR